MQIQSEVNLLYYPKLNIPSENWLKVALLYYDKIATIIPEEVYENEVVAKYSKSALLDSNNQTLLKEGYLKRVSLDDAYDFNQLTRIFRDWYKTTIDEKTKLRLKNEKTKFKIFALKFSHEIFYLLEKDGLASRNIHNDWKNDPYDSYIVPNSLGIALMSILAEYIAAIDGYNISTDMLRYSFESIGKNNKLLENKNWTNFFIGCHFLVPETMSIDQIIKFKDTYRKELTDFRIKISHFEKQLLTVSPNHIEEFINSEIKYYQAEEAIILDSLRSFGYNKITFTKIVTSVKDLISNPILGTLKIVWLTLNSKKIPVPRNNNNYSTIFKYNTYE